VIDVADPTVPMYTTPPFVAVPPFVKLLLEMVNDWPTLPR
jgi:hypothetical protein